MVKRREKKACASLDKLGNSGGDSSMHGGDNSDNDNNDNEGREREAWEAFLLWRWDYCHMEGYQIWNRCSRAVPEPGTACRLYGSRGRLMLLRACLTTQEDTISARKAV